MFWALKQDYSASKTLWLEIPGLWDHDLNLTWLSRKLYNVATMKDPQQTKRYFPARFKYSGRPCYTYFYATAINHLPL